MAKAGGKRRQYTAEQRAHILEVAQKEKLTAEGVKKKFGVTPVTYYSWRKKSGVVRRRGGRPGRPAATGGDITSQVRVSVAERVRKILPDIVRSEINQYLDALLGGGTGRRGRRGGRKKK
jgi:transposase-like protein